MIYTLFQQPTSINMRKRIAKKYFDKYWFRFDEQYLKQFENVGVGDVINTCNGLNSRITAIYPIYFQIGKGQSLADIDIQTSDNGCSFAHCGIQLPRTKQQIEETIAGYLKSPYAEKYSFDIRYRPDVCKIHEDGTATVDWNLYNKLVEEKFSEKLQQNKDNV